MTSKETKELLTNIVNDLNMAATFAGVIDPALIPFISIGMAVDKMIPGLAANVQDWVEGNPPTEEEKAETAAKLATLSDSNLP